jgi:hypothetical protein
VQELVLEFTTHTDGNTHTHTHTQSGDCSSIFNFGDFLVLILKLSFCDRLLGRGLMGVVKEGSEEDEYG